MAVLTEKFTIKTRGFNDIINITADVQEFVTKHNFNQAQLLVYVAGSTASITTIEYEPGLIKDFPEALEKIAPMNHTYHHDETWHDGNGYAHVRAAMIGNSESFPIFEGQLQLGTWQQIILVDFDNKPRTRTVIVQFLY